MMPRFTKVRSLRGLLLPLALLALFASGLPACGSDPSDPDPGPDPDPEPTPNFTFTYDAPAGAPAISSISVRGGFNSWGETRMTRGEDGVWSAGVVLEDGTHPYKFFINGAWIGDMCYDATWGDPAADYVVDPDADGCVSDGYEGQNAVVTLGEVPLDFAHTAGDPAYLSAAGGRLSVRFRARHGQVQEATVTPAGGEAVAAHRQLATGMHELWRATLPEGAASYSIEVVTPGGARSFGPYAVPAEPFSAVAWVEDAVGYQIFPERFWNGDEANDSAAIETDEIHFVDPSFDWLDPVLTDEWDGPVLEGHCCHQYFGGDLQGVIDRLDWLEGQGVTVLYFNPIFLAGSAHGYDTYDYFQVAPNFGDSAVLASLVDQAHARGMRLIWDFVPNHVGIGHWAFRDALENGEASEYWDWFAFHPNDDGLQAGDGNDYDGWWGIASLPELQTENPEVMAHLLDVARHWTERGFDGIRVDVPGDIDNRGTFFPAFRDAVKAIDPSVYLVGEIWERDPTWLQGDQFDALMNYALGHGVVEPFAQGALAGPLAAREMAAFYAAYPEAATAMMFNLVASHDTDRLLTMLGGGELGMTPGPEALARQRLAAALLFALPGMPVTYQGDECAFLGGSSGRHTARYPVQWSACDAAMAGHYAALADLKRTIPALGSPAFRAHAAAPGLLSFYRGEPGPGEVLAVFNSSPAGTTLPLPAGAWTDALTAETMSGSVLVGGVGWRYLVRS